MLFRRLQFLIYRILFAVWVGVRVPASDMRRHRVPRLPLFVVALALACAWTPSRLAAANPSAVAPTSTPSETRSIQDWVTCNGTDEARGVAAAFAASKNGAFTLVVDCPVFVHVGMDIARPIFIDNGTSVQFTGTGLITTDNVLIPAFVLANSVGVSLLDWRVQYIGGLPVNWDTGGYYDNGLFVPQTGTPAHPAYDQPGFAFNGLALVPWLEANRGIKFTQEAEPWEGPTDTSAVFYIVGATSNVQVTGLSMFVPPAATGSQFIPVAFASNIGYNNNQNVTPQTPLTPEYLSVPGNITFSDIDLDGYYMGWQGQFQYSLFQHIRGHRYGDLQDANGGNVGGVNKWFAPPHFIYLNNTSYGDTQAALENQEVQILDVIDYGDRVGVARDSAATDQAVISGNALSLKIGGFGIEVNGYTSYRPDGLLDVLTCDNMTIANVVATYDSLFLNNLYPGIRFPLPPYNRLTLENISLTDNAAQTIIAPISGSSASSNTDITLANVNVTMNLWAGTTAFLPPFAGTGNAIQITHNYSQTITFAPLYDQVLETLPFTIRATATSGLAVSLTSSTTTVCTVSGASLSLIGAGTCSITANQAGDANYASAASVVRSFTVSSTRRGRRLAAEKLFSLPLADARGSATRAESAPAFPNRYRKGVASSVFQQPANLKRRGSGAYCAGRR